MKRRNPLNRTAFDAERHYDETPFGRIARVETGIAISPAPEPEVARAQAKAALKALVAAGEARWIGRGRRQIELADGPCWRLDDHVMTRLS